MFDVIDTPHSFGFSSFGHPSPGIFTATLSSPPADDRAVCVTATPRISGNNLNPPGVCSIWTQVTAGVITVQVLYGRSATPTDLAFSLQVVFLP